MESNQSLTALVYPFNTLSNWRLQYHSKKEIDAALEYAIQHGWTYTKSKGHPAGILKCTNKKKCHRRSIPSTPRNTGDWAKRIYKWVDECK